MGPIGNFTATMRVTLFLIAILVCLGGPLQAQRAVQGEKTLQSFRPDGELRMWTFVVKDSTIGRLFSTVKGRTSINGVEAYIIEQRLGLDYTRSGSDVTIDVEGRQFVAADGTYLGSDLQIKTGDQTSRLELKRDGDTLRGYVEQGGRETDRQYHFSADGFAADIHLLDMHELFLAMRDFKVGDTIGDTMFVPQIMQKQYVEATVNMFVNKQVYKGTFDSTFVIVYSQPQHQAFYFTPDKRLVKVEIPGQQLKAYLDIVRVFDVGASEETDHALGGFVARLPVFTAYLILGLFSLVFFAGRAYRRPVTWLAFLAGGVVYLPVIVTQMPLQMYLVEHLLIPGIAAGDSPYFWGIFPALTAGVIHQILKVTVILLFGIMAKLRTDRLVIIGAVCGGAFGIVEGCHLAMLAMNVELFSWHLLERGFMILFHTTSGALIGYALASGFASRRFVLILSAMIVFDAFLRYLPVFVHQNVINVQMMYFVIPIVVVALTFFALWRFRRVP